MATGVVRLFGVADRSSCPALASVITASVVSGMISDTEPTNVVLPTPKPPATTIFAEIVAAVAIRCGPVPARRRPEGSERPPAGRKLEPTESTQHPFHQCEVRRAAGTARGLVHGDHTEPRHVTEEHPGDAERDRQERGDLGHRSGLLAQLRHGTVLDLHRRHLRPAPGVRAD